MAGKLSDLAALDDIGFIGIAAGRVLSDEDRAEFRKSIDEHRAARARKQVRPKMSSNVRAMQRQVAYA